MTNRRYCFLGIVLCFFQFQLNALSFDVFKSNIVGKDGTEVHAYVTLKLKDGFEAQVSRLREHMIGRGHFGSKTTISNANTPMKWNTFFVKDDYTTLYSTQEEQKELIRNVWNSERLTYTQDVSGSLDSVCLNGVVPGVIGVVFDNKDAERLCVEIGHRDVAMYNKENFIALKLANLRRIHPDYDPRADDFHEDLDVAQRVFLAQPRIVSNSTIRLTLEIDAGTVKFNTSYPF
ncbi:MAG: hypothetical protein LBB21_07305 [Holosporaceae bacterium]|jgi:hypothetical protein|nr:hypothetical protein [Holosporaceae bacterium]